MTIDLFDTGYFYADGGAMFGAIPKTAWSRRYPSDDSNGCVLAMRSALIRTDEGKTVLIDTGSGDKHLRQLSYYRFFGLTDLAEEIRKRGVEPEAVDEVVLTHLHFDHCGGCTRKDPASDRLVPTFPNAVHWVSRRQWDNFRFPHPLEKDSYFPENMQAVEDAGLLRIVTDDVSLAPGIDLRIYDGHTPGQLVPYIQTPGQTVVYAGDVIPLAASLSPEWISAYDTYPVTSYDEKIRMLEEAVAQRQALLFCHDAYTKGCTVKKIRDFYCKEQIISL